MLQRLFLTILRLSYFRNRTRTSKLVRLLQIRGKEKFRNCFRCLFFAYDIWGWCCWKPLSRSPGSLKFVLSSPTKCDFNPVILTCFMVSCGTTQQKGGGWAVAVATFIISYYSCVCEQKPVKTSPRRENVSPFALDCSLVFQSYRDPGQQQVC